MTVEAAFALASIIAVVMLCAAAVATMVLNIRCMDAAREVARATARDEPGTGGRDWGGVLPDGAGLEVRIDDAWVVVRVEARAPLPTIRVVAEAVAMREVVDDAADYPPPAPEGDG